MTPQEAALALAAVLRDENAALERHDFAAAGALLARKQDAARAFAQAGRPTPGKPARHIAHELAHLADTNRRLLERAMSVQREVIGTIARAAAAANATAGRYGRTGAHTGGTPGRALLSRA